MIPRRDFKVNGTVITKKCSRLIRGRDFPDLTGVEFAKLLPHEWLCGLFYLFLAARFVQVGKACELEAWIVLGFIVVHAASCIFLPLENNLRWRFRFVICSILMNATYFVLKTAIPMVHPSLEDAFLQQIDGWLVGDSLTVQLDRWTHPVLTEIFSFCYFWYLPYLFVSQARYLSQNRELAASFYTGLYTVYAVGFFGYSMMPALGPYLAMADQFKTPLAGWWMTDLTASVVLAASNRVDLFPSLHVANSLFILLFDFHHQRRRFWRCLVPCIGLFISTLYLRYHYVIDVIAGAALSLVALRLALGASGRRKGVTTT
jgi:membrane-associated phospholipid phosphatase